MIGHRALQGAGRLWSSISAGLSPAANGRSGAVLGLGRGWIAEGGLGGSSLVLRSCRQMSGIPEGLPFERQVLESVIKVYATVSTPNYFLPWTKKPQREATGSGFAIEGKRIITNAHVVADQSLVMVRKHGSAEKHIAKVAHVGHDCDLAVLTVDDDVFWEGTPHLEFGPTPHLQDRVLVAGYPTGGDSISLSVGVVSRSELQRYAHGGGTHLALQIDASINPGNSGGPALLDDGSCAVAGVAFQSLNNADRIGYIIPVQVIQHFLDDVEANGRYRGACEFGLRCQSLENPQIREFYKMPPGLSGICITSTHPLNHAGDMLQTTDILVEVDGLPVANDGTIPFREHERILLSYVLTSYFIGEEVDVKVLRQSVVSGGDPEIIELKIRLDQVEQLVPAQLFDKIPQYFVHAGLVFTPLTWPFLFEWGDDWYTQGPRKLIERAISGRPSVKDEQVVVLSQILMDQVNYGYEGVTPSIVKSFNGEKVLNVESLMRMVLTNKEEYLRFELEDDNGCSVVIQREAANASNARIFATYGIPSSASVDLQELHNTLSENDSTEVAGMVQVNL